MLSNTTFSSILRKHFSGIISLALMVMACPMFVYGAQTAAASGAYKLAIFPFEVDTFDANVSDQLAKKLEANIRSDRSLSLVFSHYNDALNDPPIAKPPSLWVRGKPSVELIVKLGRSRGADAVIVGRLEDMVDHSAFVGSVGTDMQLYLIDLHSQAVYRRSGTTRDIKKLTHKLVAEWGSKRAVASERSTPTHTATPPATTAVKSSGDFTAAMQAYQQGDYATALREWTPLAQQGDARAQNGLGDLYTHGKGVPKDKFQGAQWYYKAAAQGYAVAQNNLGVALEFGKGVKKDEVAAATWHKRAAAQGLSDAQVRLARMYRDGRGVGQDYGQALRWYREAAAQGDSNAKTVAQLELADMYRDGLGVPQDKAQALQWYRQAAAQGYASAQYKLAEMYRYGEGVAKSLGQARTFYQAAQKSESKSLARKATAALAEIDRELASRKRARAQASRRSVASAESHSKGQATARDTTVPPTAKKEPSVPSTESQESVKRSLSRPISKGSATAQNETRLGSANIASTSEKQAAQSAREPNKQQQVEQDAKMEGRPPSNDRATMPTTRAEGSEQGGVVGWLKGLLSSTQVAATKTLETTQANNHTSSATQTECDRLAGNPNDPNRVGKGVAWKELDTGRAVEACKRAISEDPNNPRYQYQYGRALQKAGQHQHAMRWYRQAAEQGYIAAQFALGSMYAKGKGVAQNYTEAAKWFRHAAEQGDARAQFNLGVMYDKGKGVAQNYTEAAKWYRQAAEQGNAPAQFNLGLKYDYGMGVAKNDTEAAKWYRKAAEQGHSEAQAALRGISGAEAKSAARETASASTLDSLAKGCPVKNVDGTPVGFHPTQIPTSIKVTAQEVCGIARRTVDNSRKTSEKAVASFCGPMDQYVNERFAGSYAQAIEVIGSQRYGDPTMEKAYKMLTTCRPEDRRKQVRQITAPISIYSVGSFVHQGQSCRGYVYELKGPKGSRVYELEGLGDCAGLTTAGNKTLFHPKNNPNGTYLGDHIRTVLKYDSALPETWNYFGTEYPLHASQQGPAGAPQETADQETTPPPSQVRASSGTRDTAVRYAENLIANFLALPHCIQLASTMRTVASSNSPVQVRMLQIDRMLDSADRAGCVVY
jgi:TPR repeat protein